MPQLSGISCSLLPYLWLTGIWNHVRLKKSKEIRRGKAKNGSYPVLRDRVYNSSALNFVPDEKMRLLLNLFIGVSDHEKVVAAHRIPSYNKRRTAPIIVKFATYEERDVWISNFKAVRPLTASKVNPSFNSSEKIFINEHLSPENKQLLARAKESARDKNYKYVWSRDGKIFMRKENGGKCKKIDSFDDLDTL
ncbi:hypothetical protein J6590_089497 [Homalodisca vitripennis]|nr:hypothetical protein J6590_089497 [Homalodisca vitripennis]